MSRSSFSGHCEAGKRANGVELGELFYKDVATDSEGETVGLLYLLMKLVADCRLLMVATD